MPINIPTDISIVLTIRRLRIRIVSDQIKFYNQKKALVNIDHLKKFIPNVLDQYQLQVNPSSVAKKLKPLIIGLLEFDAVKRY